MVIVLLVFVSAQAWAEKIVQSADGAGCVLNASFEQNPDVELISAVEKLLIEADSDMLECMSESAETVRGCSYNGAKVAIVKNPVGWGMQIERGKAVHAMWVTYGGDTTAGIRIEGFSGDTDQVTALPKVRGAITTLISTPFDGKLVKK